MASPSAQAAGRVAMPKACLSLRGGGCGVSKPDNSGPSSSKLSPCSKPQAGRPSMPVPQQQDHSDRLSGRHTNCAAFNTLAKLQATEDVPTAGPNSGSHRYLDWSGCGNESGPGSISRSQSTGDLSQRSGDSISHRLSGHGSRSQSSALARRHSMADTPIDGAGSFEPGPFARVWSTGDLSQSIGDNPSGRASSQCGGKHTSYAPNASTTRHSGSNLCSQSRPSVKLQPEKMQEHVEVGAREQACAPECERCGW